MKRMFAAVLLLAGSACGGGGNPKQYVLALTNKSVVAGPNADCPLIPDPNITSKGYLGDITLTIYQGDSQGDWFADLPPFGDFSSITLQGKEVNGSYTFSGSRLDDQVNDLSNKLWEQKETYTINLTIKDDGSNNVTGDFSFEDHDECDNIGGDNQACKNAGRPEWNGQRSTTGNTVDCIITGKLQGVRLADPAFQQHTSTPGGSSIPNNF